MVVQASVISSGKPTHHSRWLPIPFISAFQKLPMPSEVSAYSGAPHLGHLRKHPLWQSCSHPVFMMHHGTRYSKDPAQTDREGPMALGIILWLIRIECLMLEFRSGLNLPGQVPWKESLGLAGTVMICLLGSPLELHAKWRMFVYFWRD